MIRIPAVKNVDLLYCWRCCPSVDVIIKVDVRFWLWESHIFVMLTTKGTAVPWVFPDCTCFVLLVCFSLTYCFSLEMQTAKQMEEAMYNGSYYQRNLWFGNWTSEPMTLWNRHCIKYGSNFYWDQKKRIALRIFGLKFWNLFPFGSWMFP